MDMKKFICFLFWHNWKIFKEVKCSDGSLLIKSECERCGTIQERFVG